MKNTEGVMLTLQGAHSASFQLPIYQGVRSMSFSLFSDAECDQTPADTGSMLVFIQHSQARTLIYHGPVNQTAYGSPVHVYESSKPFNTTANYTVTFDAFDSQPVPTPTTISGNVAIRITFESEPL
jgi:hypothetical protein